jgi:hypothetical protein
MSERRRDIKDSAAFTLRGSKVAEDPDDKGEEGRRAARVRTFLEARVSYSDGAISTPCTVNQLSEVGARINIAKTFTLPDTFEITIPQRNVTRRAKLVWRRDELAGIDFIDASAGQPVATADPTARIKALEAENAKLKAQIGVLMQQLHRLTEE